jgi:hypothetical protein
MSIATRDNNEIMLSEIESTEKICTALLKSKHYEKIGRDGIFAIVQKAASLGIKPIEALNGGMYYVQGKVELSAITMARLIRQQKHSITMDKNSTPTMCILHGRRADNGDTWKASFSIDDAKRAGIYKEGSPWSKYPDIMCYNRALSKLARQLFPDVIGNCYVEGEISEATPLYDSHTVQDDECDISVDVADDKVSPEQIEALKTLLMDCDDNFIATVFNFLQQRFGKPDFSVLPADMYETISKKLVAHLDQNRDQQIA